ncbi:MAG: hypothetical protein ACLP1Q_09190, partial [Solirubrobacteraceae bacterium]
VRGHTQTVSVMRRLFLAHADYAAPTGTRRAVSMRLSSAALRILARARHRVLEVCVGATVAGAPSVQVGMSLQLP